MTDREAEIARAREALARHERALLSAPGVVGAGIGLRRQAGRSTDEICIVVSVLEPGASGRRIPAAVDGVPVEVRATGEFRAL